jgi:hypothetical protein
MLVTESGRSPFSQTSRAGETVAALKWRLVSTPETLIWNPVAKRAQGENNRQMPAAKLKTTERLQKFIIQSRITRGSL